MERLEQRVLADDHQRRKLQWLRLGRLQHRRQHYSVRAHRHDDDCWWNVHRDAGRTVVHDRHVREHTVRWPDRRQRQRQRDESGRLHVDRIEQRVLAHAQRHKLQWFGIGRLQYRREHDSVGSHRDDDDRWRDVHGHAVGALLLVCTLREQPVAPVRRRNRLGDHDRNERVCGGRPAAARRG